MCASRCLSSSRAGGCDTARARACVAHQQCQHRSVAALQQHSQDAPGHATRRQAHLAARTGTFGSRCRCSRCPAGARGASVRASARESVLVCKRMRKRCFMRSRRQGPVGLQQAVDLRSARRAPRAVLCCCCCLALVPAITSLRRHPLCAATPTHPVIRHEGHAAQAAHGVHQQQRAGALAHLAQPG
jgi:hypothetical protein